ncbi:MAG: polysaccharide deacetylase family protein [Gemmatimonadaceae bacterium]
MRAILTYHSIDESGSPISVDPRVFRTQMEFLAAGRPRVVPLAEISRHDAPNETVALTFDDGFANFETIAAPLLMDLGLTATVFVVTDHVGAHNDWAGPGIVHGSVPSLPLMPWDALGRLAEHGMEIAAHTRTHPRLSVAWPAALAEEVGGSSDRIQKEIGTRPLSFAYPYGDLDNRVVRAVGRSYQRACTTELRALEPDDDCLRLPRLDVYYFRAVGLLEQWGSSAFQRRLWIRAQARRVRRLVTAAAVRA